MIDSLLAHRLAKHGKRIAVIAHDGALTYVQLASAVAGVASRLARNGVKRGDRVAVQWPNSCVAVVHLLGAAQLGAVVVPVQVSLKDDALRATTRDCEARLAICPPVLSKYWNCVTESAAPVNSLAADVSLAAALGRDHDQLAAILYTSGSTGAPKGVMLSRANMDAALDAVHDYLAPGPDDVFYSALPLSSSYGLYQLVSALSLGAKLVLDRSFAFPVQSLRILREHRATIFAAVPTQVAWLLAHPDVGVEALTSLRLITTAAASLPIDHAQRLRAMLPAARLFVMYGQTECKRISYLDPSNLDRKPGSVGQGLRIQRHMLLDESGRRVAAGELGELAVQGPHVMQGYWRNPELTNEVLRTVAGESGRWLHTGDVFRQDLDGYLYFQGRRDEILKIGGHKVSPIEIENAILKLTEVSEVAVIGQPDAQWGQVARALVVLADGAHASVETIVRQCAASLPRYMIPKSVEFRATLPKTESGKMRKRDLS